MTRRPLAAFGLAVLLAAAPAGAEEAAPGAAGAPPASTPKRPFSAAEESAIRAVVRDYLVENPEVIVEAIEAMRERQREAERAAGREAVAANAEALYQDPEAPVLGNPEGDVTIVEFFDYRCGYCKRAFPGLMELVERDGNIRLVMKEFPILGPESTVAARAALAARDQGKYAELHVKLMQARGELTEDAVMAIARSAGLDVDRLREDMGSEAIDAALAGNLALAKRLSIRGTPAFVIGGELIPGAVGADKMRALVEAERERAG